MYLVWQTVMHAFLEAKKMFAHWIKDRIEKYGFTENQDYICSPILVSKGRGGHNAKECHLTIDMSKELAMVERNEKGKQARRPPPVRFFRPCGLWGGFAPEIGLAGAAGSSMGKIKGRHLGVLLWWPPLIKSRTFSRVSHRPASAGIETGLCHPSQLSPSGNSAYRLDLMDLKLMQGGRCPWRWVVFS